MPKLTYYSVLGIDENADTKKIQQAWKKRSLVFSVDKNRDAELHNTFFNQIKEILLDKRKKKIYDTHVKNGTTSELKKEDGFVTDQQVRAMLDFEETAKLKKEMQNANPTLTFENSKNNPIDKKLLAILTQLNNTSTFSFVTLFEYLIQDTLNLQDAKLSSSELNLKHDQKLMYKAIKDFALVYKSKKNTANITILDTLLEHKKELTQKLAKQEEVQKKNSPTRSSWRTWGKKPPEISNSAASDPVADSKFSLQILGVLIQNYDPNSAKSSKNNTHKIIHVPKNASQPIQSFSSQWNTLKNNQHPSAIQDRNSLLEKATFEELKTSLVEDEELNTLESNVIRQLFDHYCKKLTSNINNEASDVARYIRAHGGEDFSLIATLIHQSNKDNEFIQKLYIKLVTPLSTISSNKIKYALSEKLESVGYHVFLQNDSMLPHVLKTLEALPSKDDKNSLIITHSLTPEWVLRLAKNKEISQSFLNRMFNFHKNQDKADSNFSTLVLNAVNQYNATPNTIKEITDFLEKTLALENSQLPFTDFRNSVKFARFYVNPESCQKAEDIQFAQRYQEKINDKAFFQTLQKNIKPTDQINTLLSESNSNAEEKTGINQQIIDLCQNKEFLFKLHDDAIAKEASSQTKRNWQIVKKILDLDFSRSFDEQNKALKTNTKNSQIAPEPKFRALNLTKVGITPEEWNDRFEKNYATKHTNSVSSCIFGRHKRIRHYWGESVACPLPIRTLGSWLYFGKPQTPASQTPLADSVISSEKEALTRQNSALSEHSERSEANTATLSSKSSSHKSQSVFRQTVGYSLVPHSEEHEPKNSPENSSDSSRSPRGPGFSMNDID